MNCIGFLLNFLKEKRSLPFPLSFMQSITKAKILRCPLEHTQKKSQTISSCQFLFSSWCFLVSVSAYPFFILSLPLYKCNVQDCSSYAGRIGIERKTWHFKNHYICWKLLYNSKLKVITMAVTIFTKKQNTCGQEIRIWFRKKKCVPSIVSFFKLVQYVFLAVFVN